MLRMIARHGVSSDTPESLFTSRKGQHTTLQYRVSHERKTTMIAFDMESHGLGGAWAGGAYQTQGEETVQFTTTPLDVIRAIFSEKLRGAVWFAHNGGEYDYKYLLTELLVHQKKHPTMRIHVVVQGKGRVIGFKIHYRNQTYEFRDSYALMPASLRKLTEQLAPEFLKKEFDHEHTTFDIKNTTHREYLEYDVRGLLSILIRFKALIYENFGVDVGWTAASTALRCWLASLPKHVRYFRQPKRVRDFCRKAYFGGMVALRDTNWHEDVTGVDVNAMYPYIMLQGVPVGFACYTRQYEPERPGIYRVMVTVPANNIYPMAPWRDAQYGVGWPTGTFETYLCSKELEDIRAYGVTWEVLEGIAFDRMEYPFQEFITKCEQLELEHTGTALALVVKIMRNSLYGKFGAREDTQEYILSEEQPQSVNGLFMPAIDEQTGEPHEMLWTHPKTLDAPYLHPEWATWVTAGARCLNRAVAYAVGLEFWLYCDTDSNIFTSSAVSHACASGAVNIGPNYGALKIEKTYDLFRATGPKVYTGVLTPGIQEFRCKGIPARSVTTADITQAFTVGAALPTIAYTGMNGTLQVLKRGKAYSEPKMRTFPNIANSRHWFVRPDGVVRPIHLEQEIAP